VTGADRAAHPGVSEGREHTARRQHPGHLVERGIAKRLWQGRPRQSADDHVDAGDGTLGEDGPQLRRAGLSHLDRRVTTGNQLRQARIDLHRDVSAATVQASLDDAGERTGAWTEFHDYRIAVRGDRGDHGLGQPTGTRRDCSDDRGLAREFPHHQRSVPEERRADRLCHRHCLFNSAAARSAIPYTVAMGLFDGSDGMTDASATRSPEIP
jgi:hypothetical protein